MRKMSHLLVLQPTEGGKPKRGMSFFTLREFRLPRQCVQELEGESAELVGAWMRGMEGRGGGWEERKNSSNRCFKVVYAKDSLGGWGGGRVQWCLVFRRKKNQYRSLKREEEPEGCITGKQVALIRRRRTTLGCVDLLLVHTFHRRLLFVLHAWLGSRSPPHPHSL